jgi:hypothetical protein
MVRNISMALVGALLLVAGQANAQGAGATLQCSQGSAEVNRGGKDGWQKAGSGTALAAGDRVRVLPGGVCNIAYAAGGTTAVAAGTTVAITTVPAAAAGGAAAGGLAALGGTAFLPIVGGAVLAGGLAAVIAANDDNASPR